MPNAIAVLYVIGKLMDQFQKIAVKHYLIRVHLASRNKDPYK